MVSTYPTDALADALVRLRRPPFPAAAVGFLAARTQAINRELGEAVRAGVPAYSQSGNPDLLPELALHGPEHTAEILRLLGGGDPGEFEFVRVHARRRAEQHFPLEAHLHAFRCGHKVFSRWLREAILATLPSPRDAQQAVADAADFALEYTDAISTLAAGTYVEHTRLIADVAGDQRAELLNLLLEGYDESDGRVAGILRTAGYLDRRRSFCVALARPVDPAEMANPARARRLLETLDRLFRRSRIRRLGGLRDGKVTIAFSDFRRTSGWTAPQTSLARRVADELARAGNAVLIGVSNDAPSTARIPAAWSEASLALELSTVTRRVTQFSQIPARRLLLHFAREDFKRAMPGWFPGFSAADRRARGALAATVRAYADADMNVLKAAAALAVHPNTIYARLQRIDDLTGLDARSFHALTELLTVIDCATQDGEGLDAG